MKVVEFLSNHYSVALLNSKNAWRILGQESYAFEIAQALNYHLEGLVFFVPIGNAGNITAILSGFRRWTAQRIDRHPAQDRRGPVPSRQPRLSLLPGALTEKEDF